MAKQTIKGFVYCEKSRFRDEPEFGFTMHRPTQEIWPDRVVIQEQEIEVEIPDNFDPRIGLVANLEERKQAVRAAYLAKVKEIDDRINSLLALEMS